MMNMLPDPAKEVMTRGRAEKEYVTREEFERFRRGDRILWLILGLGLIIAGWVGMARADTTKMTIDTAYPAVVTVRVPLSRLAQIDSILSHLSFLDGKIVVDCPVAIDVRGKLRCGEYALFVQYLPRMEDSCDGIRSFLVDTTPVVRARGLDSTFVLGHDSTYQIEDVVANARQNQGGVKTDIYFTKDTTVFIRDPHWVYFNWSNGKRTNMRTTK